MFVDTPAIACVIGRLISNEHVTNWANLPVVVPERADLTNAQQRAIVRWAEAECADNTVVATRAQFGVLPCSRWDDERVREPVRSETEEEEDGPPQADLSDFASLSTRGHLEEDALQKDDPIIKGRRVTLVRAQCFEDGLERRYNGIYSQRTVYPPPKPEADDWANAPIVDGIRVRIARPYYK
jgi:hypothetical protein